MIVIFALVLDTSTTVPLPFLDQEKLLFRFVWKIASSMNTQLLVKSKSMRLLKGNPTFLPNKLIEATFSNLKISELFGQKIQAYLSVCFF